jgi:hypothetical protein
LLVGLAGFEPTTSRPPDGRATRLRYSPTLYRCDSGFYPKDKGKFMFAGENLTRGVRSRLEPALIGF